MIVRTVTGNVNTLAGVDIPNATFSLVPETYVFGSTSTDVIFGDLKTIVADGNGDVSFDLHEGKYVGRISTTQGPKTFRLIVDSEGPWTLGRLIGPLGDIDAPLVAAVFDAADRAEAAADTAVSAAADVEFPVSYAPQTLDPAEQAQARENIGAADDEEVVKVTEQTLTSPQQEQARENISALGYVEQTLTAIQQAQARENIGVVASDGSIAMTGDLDMGANKVTDLADGTDPTDAAAFGQLPKPVPDPQDDTDTNAYLWSVSDVQAVAGDTPSLTEPQVTDPDDTTFGTVSGQRLAQSFDEREQQVGVGQTWQDVLSSRAHSTSYQNATEKPIQVNVYASVSTNREFEASPDGITWIAIGRISSISASTICSIIPVGWFYRLQGEASIIFWSELR